MQTVVIASLLSGAGSTGVETHIRSVIRAATAHGLNARLVTPYASTQLVQRLCNRLVNVWRPFAEEAAHLWLRKVHRRRLKRHLRIVVGDTEGAVTIYAQDPLSAEVALEVAPEFGCRVVAVAHFNVSEANEFVDKGITEPGAALWQELMATDATALPQVDRLIVVSRFMRESLFSRIPALRNSDCIVLPNICPVAPGPESNARPRRDAVSIGSLESRKNQQFLLRVIAECKQRGKPYTLDLIGDGEDREMLTALAGRLGVDHLVRFLGQVPGAAEYIRDYRVLLHAAHMESFGIVLVEAMAHGVPVIAAPVGGVPEVFSDQEEGLFWDPQSVGRGADTLIGLLEDPGLQSRLTHAARNRIAARFDPETIATRWLSAITGTALLPATRPS